MIIEKYGYCVRVPHSKDARRVVVHITKTGEDLMGEVFPKFREIEDNAVSNLTSDEFETSIDSLRTMLHTMEELNKNDKTR